MFPRPRFLVAATALLVAALPSRPVAAADVVEGEVFAYLSVTVDPDESGTILVPSPFTVIPGVPRAAIHVPEADGILVLRGDRILHHFPAGRALPPPDDLEAREDLLVAGVLPPAGRAAAELRIYDLTRGLAIAPVRTHNPHLFVDPQIASLWRVVVGSETVGVYHPDAGASYPLWSRDKGLIASSKQVARASAGIGFGGRTKMVPLADGSVSVRRGTSVAEFAGPDAGDFVDAAPDGAALFLQPATTVRSDADGDLLLPHEHSMRLIEAGGRRTDFRLLALDDDVEATRLVIRGRPVRVRGDRVYWIFVGIDFLEIRTAELRKIVPLGS